MDLNISQISTENSVIIILFLMHASLQFDISDDNANDTAGIYLTFLSVRFNCEVVRSIDGFVFWILRRQDTNPSSKALSIA